MSEKTTAKPIFVIRLEKLAWDNNDARDRLIKELPEHFNHEYHILVLPNTNATGGIKNYTEFECYNPDKLTEKSFETIKTELYEKLNYTPPKNTSTLRIQK